MPTRQAGILLKKSMTCLRRNWRVMTALPALSTPCTWNTFLARSTPMVLTCIWTTPSDDPLFNDHPMAHSMPGAGVVHHIILDRVSWSRLPLDVRFDLKATKLAWLCDMSRRANCRHGPLAMRRKQG